MTLKQRIKALVASALRYMVASLSLAILLYIAFALVFSSEEERRLQEEEYQRAIAVAIAQGVLSYLEETRS